MPVPLENCIWNESPLPRPTSWPKWKSVWKSGVRSPDHATVACGSVWTGGRPGATCSASGLPLCVGKATSPVPSSLMLKNPPDTTLDTDFILTILWCTLGSNASTSLPLMMMESPCSRTTVTCLPASARKSCAGPAPLSVALVRVGW